MDARIPPSGFISSGPPVGWARLLASVRNIRNVAKPFEEAAQDKLTRDVPFPRSGKFAGAEPSLRTAVCAGKKITGRKRHIVDTHGLLLGVSVHAADIPDRDGTTRAAAFCFHERISPGGYQGPKMAKTIAATGCWRW